MMVMPFWLRSMDQQCTPQFLKLTFSWWCFFFSSIVVLGLALVVKFSLLLFSVISYPNPFFSAFILLRHVHFYFSSAELTYHVHLLHWLLMLSLLMSPSSEQSRQRSSVLIISFFPSISSLNWTPCFLHIVTHFFWPHGLVSL